LLSDIYLRPFFLLIDLYSASLQAADENFGFMEIRSQSPLQQLRCGPIHHVPWILPGNTYILRVSHNWKNIWLYREEAYRIDAEIHEINSLVRFGLGGGFEITGELPVRFTSGGILDALIEGFHNFLNLSNAERDKFSRDDFAFEIHNGASDDGWSYAGASQTGWNLGNTTIAFSCDLGRILSINSDLIVTLGLKLPTSTRTDFFGNQSVDPGLSVSTGITTGPLHWYFSSAVNHYGDKQMVGIRLHQWHLSSLVGLEYKNKHNNHAWTAQLLTENGVAHNLYEFSESTYEVIIGYRRQLSEKVSLDIGFLENMFVFDNSPDIGFHTAFTYGP